jgi:hypothetical protein
MLNFVALLLSLLMQLKCTLYKDSVLFLPYTITDTVLHCSVARFLGGFPLTNVLVCGVVSCMRRAPVFCISNGCEISIQMEAMFLWSAKRGDGSVRLVHISFQI